MRLSIRSAIIFAVVLCAGQSVQAVILNGRTARLTSAPGGALTNSGWQWEGDWSDFLGTPIGRSYFITAGHVGGSVGDDFFFDGQSYQTIHKFDDPGSDLEIWQVNGNFPTWAPIYRAKSDRGKLITIFGRGTDRGGKVVANGQVKGWAWGPADGSQSWGTNISDGATTINGTGFNGALFWTFDRNGTKQEGTISNGDSGGGVFLKDTDGRWKLAGVNFTVDSTFSIPGQNINFDGAIFDEGGLSFNGDIIPDTAADIPSRAYATRITSRSTWIQNVIYGRVSPSLVPAGSGSGVPEPGSTGLLLMCTISFFSRRRRI